MNALVSVWPVCGNCCEVAPYSWLGEPHHCVRGMRADGRGVGPSRNLARRVDDFTHYLTEALAHGDPRFGGAMDLDAETCVAIGSVAAEFPDPADATVASAHEAFARELRGIHFNESRAVMIACTEGVIAQLARPDPDADDTPGQAYGAHSIRAIDPDPASAREWILANRANPSELYRRYVLDGDWTRTCEEPRSYVVGFELGSTVS